MDIIEFFRDVTIISFGLLFIIFWVVLIILGSVEVYDLVTGKNPLDEEDL